MLVLPRPSAAGGQLATHLSCWWAHLRKRCCNVLGGQMIAAVNRIARRCSTRARCPCCPWTGTRTCDTRTRWKGNVCTWTALCAMPLASVSSASHDGGHVADSGGAPSPSPASSSARLEGARLLLHCVLERLFVRTSWAARTCKRRASSGQSEATGAPGR